MKYNRVTRRHFLQGLGGSILYLPMLGSLMSAAEARAAGASGRLKRFVAIGGDNGRYATDWYPTMSYSSMAAVAAPDRGYRTAPLSAITGNISNIFQNSYSFGGVSPVGPNGFAGKIREDMTLLRGLDGLWENRQGHQLSAMLGGNLGRPDFESKMGPTIDVLMANHPKIYPTAPKRRLITAALDYGSSLSYSYDAAKNEISDWGVHPWVWDLHKSLFGGATDTKSGQRKRKIVDLVKEDYDRLKKNSRLSAADRRQLDEHFTKLSELHDSMATLSCTGPSITGIDFGIGTPNRNLAKASIDVMAMALKCGISNLFTYSVNRQTDDQVYQLLGASKGYHSLTHESMSGPEAREIQKWFASNVSYFYDQLNVEEGTTGQRYIDSTLIFFGNCMGDGTAHSYFDMPVVLIGGGSVMKTGQYIDYSAHDANPIAGGGGQIALYPGRNYSQFLVTVLKMMGLEAGDYKYPGVADGWGSDTPGWDPYADFAKSKGLPTAWRRSRTTILPGLLKT